VLVKDVYGNQLLNIRSSL
jgi:calpain-15